MKYIMICAILVLGLTLPALAAEVKDLENYVEQNFMLKQGETAIDGAIRLLTRFKEIRPERETEEIVTTIEKGNSGRTYQVYETRYADTGELISSREETTSYYATGELNMIHQKWFDAEGKLVRHRIVKYINGQPKVMEIEPKPIEK